MPDETYFQEVYCSNCPFKGGVYILKGTKINDSPCPNCGCKELERSYENVTLTPHNENYE